MFKNFINLNKAYNNLVLKKKHHFSKRSKIICSFLKLRSNLVIFLLFGILFYGPGQDVIKVSLVCESITERFFVHLVLGSNTFSVFVRSINFTTCDQSS